MNLEKVFVYISLIGIDFFLWKYALAGLLGKKLIFRRGKEKYEIVGKRIKFYGVLYLLAAIGVGWTILGFLKEEF